MLIFDQLKKSDPQLRWVTLGVLGGMSVLLVGLWWVQVVSASNFQQHLETQSYRSIRIPAERGKILDRRGNVLAENRPVYNVMLYLDELRDQFDAAYEAEVARMKQQLADSQGSTPQKPGSKSESPGKTLILDKQQRNAIRNWARYSVASNLVAVIARRLGEPLTLSATNFERHYEARLALPYPVARNLDPVQVARFEEQSPELPGVDLEVQSIRYYPHQATAAHLLGYLQRDDRSVEGEDAFFSYRLPDYRGIIGVEYGFDTQLHGRAGEKSVLVNNLGYRQAENIWSPAEPGRNVVLTIDLGIQQAAEKALPVFGPKTRAAAVVMDVHTGDVLALASVPGFNPNYFLDGFPPGEYQRVQEDEAEKNRATQENYMPGSIFKTVVSMACLESGMDPGREIYNPGYVYVGRAFHDTAPPGFYNFRRALKLSSNTYFITNGLGAGIENIVKFGERLELGQRFDLPTRQETSGNFPSWKRIHSGWSDGDTANLCIGQGYIDVTPLQMTVLASAIANGGNVLWPRIVDRVESQDPASDEPPQVFPKGRIRSELGVSPRTLHLLREAMLADTEDPDGSGREAALPGIRICGKTGTAQKKDARGQLVEHITWFLSYAPYENPRYAVVVMIEGGSSGGGTCAPVARLIYQAILDSERTPPPQNLAQAK